MYAISYRREDTGHITGRIHERLAKEFGKKSVFMDIDSINPGFDFREKITITLSVCKAVLVVIGPHWAGQTAAGKRRIDNPADFVRIEVGHALKRDIAVIPVLIDRTEMPDPDSLPEDLQNLAYRQAVRVDSGIDFNYHMERLCNALTRLPEPKPKAPPKPAAEAPAQTSPAAEPAPSLAVDIPTLDDYPKRKFSKLAIASVILACVPTLGISFLAMIGVLPAIVCGYLARKAICNDPALKGKWLALAGLILGGLRMAYFVALHLGLRIH